jgi:protein TonB
VGEDGRVTGAEVVKSNSRFLNAAALRSVAKLKRQFVPARLDGEVIKSRIVVPVYFTLHMPTNFASDRPSDRLLDRPIPFRNR